MQAINKEITKLVGEIILVLLFVIVTHFIWNKLEINNYRTYAANSYMYTLSIKETKSVDNKLLPLSNEEAKKLEYSELTIENLINEPREYSLFLVIAKNSTLDYSKVSIMIDNEIYILKDQNRIEDETYIYITLNTAHIEEINTHKVRIYLNENATIEEEYEILNYYFEIKENNQLFAAK